MKNKKTLGLDFVWKIRCRLRAEGSRLRAEGFKLRAEGSKLWAEGSRLRAEGDKLRAEGDKLWAEGDKLWAEGILEVHGNIKIEWISDTECQLETGELFKPL